MGLVKALRGKKPTLGEETFVAETAVIIGNVTTGKQCSIWYNAVLRGDVNSIELGDCVNIQDNVMVHGTYEKSSTKLGNNVSVGHNAILHGCVIEDNVLIGMGAIVMDDCLVESHSIVAAGAVVTKGSIIKSGELWAGVPAKKIGEVSKALKEGEIERIAQAYVKYGQWYKESDV